MPLPGVVRGTVTGTRDGGSVVHAIVALHGGVLVSGRGEDESPLFTVELIHA